MKSLIAILLVGFSVSALGQTPKPQPKRPPAGRLVTDQKQFLVPSKVDRTYIVTGVLATTRLVDSTTPPPALKEEGKTGGFACARLWQVTLQVTSESTAVTVVPPLLEVKTGDCVLWHVEASDHRSVGIRQLKFFDTDSDIPAGKHRGPNKIGVGRAFCENPEAPDCSLLVALPPGRYGYKVVVRHDATDKTTDPDLDVSCTGCVAAP